MSINIPGNNGSSVKRGSSVNTNPRFPLPDIKEEIERAGRYTGPLVPGAADEAAK